MGARFCGVCAAGRAVGAAGGSQRTGARGEGGGGEGQAEGGSVGGELGPHQQSAGDGARTRVSGGQSGECVLESFVRLPFLRSLVRVYGHDLFYCWRSRRGVCVCVCMNAFLFEVTFFFIFV